MAIKLISVKCPECGASLNIEEGREKIFCAYCGTKVFVQNENEHIYRHIDEAEVKKAETERLIRMKQLEIEEKRQEKAEQEKAERRKKAQTIIGISLLGVFLGFTFDLFTWLLLVGMWGIIIGALMWISTINTNKKDNAIGFSSKSKVPKPITKIPDFTIKVPSDVEYYHSKNYTDIEAMFTSAGFTNVKCIPLNDLRMGVLTSPSKVDSITINGQEIHGGGEKFPKNANVVISYHSLYHK